MSRWAKLGLVAAGYGLAVVAGAGAAYLYNVRTAALPYDTSGGMYAGGEFLTSLGVFLVVALAPTLLALWFIRKNARLWRAVAVGSLAFACVGLIAALMFVLSPGTPRDPLMMFLSLLGLAQLLGVPLWTVGFVLFAFLAPTRAAKRMLVAAVAVELIIGVCAAFHWFRPGAGI